MQDICRIGQDNSFEISPYPLPDMCRKCEEMSCFGSLGHVGKMLKILG